MERIIRFLKMFGFAGIGLAALILVGAFVFRGGEKTEVTSRTVLDRISDSYFVVTKTVILDQSSDIEVDRGSSWSNLLWGQTIEARADVRLDLGVDLSGLTEKDIEVDHLAKTVTITLPEATILDASLSGSIEVSNRQGILKRILDNDPTGDHNLASAQLVSDARAAISERPELTDEAREDSAKILKLVIEDLGYTFRY